MGRSAKLMKRPTKAEKVARQINTTNIPRPSRRSPSPESADSSTIKSAIPLFNTSAKRRAAHLKDYDPMSLDSSLANSPIGTPRSGTGPTSMVIDRDAEGGLEPDVKIIGASGKDAATPNKSSGVKKKGLKDKIKAAKEGIKGDNLKTMKKLGKHQGVLGGVDYLKLHESRPGGFKKKIR